MAGDPREKRNLAGTDASHVADLDGSMQEMTRVAAGAAVAKSEDVKMDDATRERLRALGYVQ